MIAFPRPSYQKRSLARGRPEKLFFRKRSTGCTAESNHRRAIGSRTYDGRVKTQNELVELVQSLPGSTVENPTVGPLWRGPGADEQARHLPSPSPFKFPTVRYLHVLYRKPGGGSRRQL